MSDVHSFSVEVAKEVGVNAAILLQSIKWWCKKNEANGRHYHEGLFWTYNSTKAIMELYPYLGRSAIDGAIKKLENGGYIRIGNFNKTAYDKTRWFAITPLGLALFDGNPCTKSEMEGTKSEIDCTNTQLRLNESVQPIPVGFSSSNNSIPDTSRDEPPYEEIIGYLNDKAHRNFSPMVKSYRENIRARWSEYPQLSYEEKLEKFKHAIDAKCAEWLGDEKTDKWLRPSTLFRPSHFDEYSTQPITQQHKTKTGGVKPEYSEFSVGTVRIDNRTGNSEIYKGNGVWEKQEPITEEEHWYDDIDI